MRDASSLSDLLEHHIEHRGNDLLLSTVGPDGTPDQSLTGNQFAQLVCNLAAAIIAGGVKPGGRVLVALPNVAAFPATFFACAITETQLVPLNLRNTESDWAGVIAMMRPKAIVTSHSLRERLAGLCSMLGEPVIWVETLAEPADGTAMLHEAATREAGNDPVSFGFTSGTTGVPKAIGRNERQWLRIGRIQARAMAVGTKDRLFIAQPCYYGDPFYLFMTALTGGASFVLAERFRAETFLQAAAACGATKLFAIGAMPLMILNRAPDPSIAKGSVQGCLSVGVPRDQHALLETATGFPWYEVYGQTETATVLIQGFDEPRDVGEGWFGRPVPDCEVRLRDPESGELVIGDGSGVLEVRGPLVAKEARTGAGELVRIADAEGWLSTGDQMERRGSHYRFGRRVKDIVRRAGENIAAVEVEDALRSVPGIAEAAVTPAADPIREEEVWAIISPDETRTAEPPQALVEFVVMELERLLARHKRPRYVSVVSEFPRTPSERVDKRRARHLACGSVYDRESGRWTSLEP